MKKLLLLSLVTAMSLLGACSSEDNDTVNEPNDCEEAFDATAEAQASYDAATDANFVQRCVAYKAALEAQIELCGDTNGSLQARIDDLGDCALAPATAGTITLTAGSAPMVFDEVTVVKVGTTLKVTAETSAPNDYSVYFEITEGAEGANVVQNFKIQLISLFQPMAGQFQSNIVTNEEGALNGTFHGYVQNNDNGTLELTSGNINLDY